MMKALIVYVYDTRVVGAEGAGAGASSPAAAPTYPALDSLTSAGQCGLAAYVDEAVTSLGQFFSGLRGPEQGAGAKDTTSQVMRLREAPSAWVTLGGEDGFDPEGGAGVAVPGGLHEVFREETMDGLASRVGGTCGEGRGWENGRQLLFSPRCSCALAGLLDGSIAPSSPSSPSSPACPGFDVIYVVLSAGGNGSGNEIAERFLSGVASVSSASSSSPSSSSSSFSSFSNAFVALVVERPGHDIHEIAGRNARSFTPRQSFMFRGSEGVSARRDMVSTVVYRGPREAAPLSNGGVRVDGVGQLEDVEGVYAEGCGKCVLAERVLYEVAYKIGRSDKYGS